MNAFHRHKTSRAAWGGCRWKGWMDGRLASAASRGRLALRASRSLSEPDRELSIKLQVLTCDRAEASKKDDEQGAYVVVRIHRKGW